MNNEITMHDQIAEVGRELGIRRNVYPKFVASGRLTQAEADRHIARLEAAYQTLKGLEQAIRPIVERVVKEVSVFGDDGK